MLRTSARCLFQPDVGVAHRFAVVGQMLGLAVLDELFGLGEFGGGFG
jgi:hypothetical protein